MAIKNEKFGDTNNIGNKTQNEDNQSTIHNTDNISYRKTRWEHMCPPDGSGNFKQIGECLLKIARFHD